MKAAIARTSPNRFRAQCTVHLERSGGHFPLSTAHSTPHDPDGDGSERPCQHPQERYLHVAIDVEAALALYLVQPRQLLPHSAVHEHDIAWPSDYIATNPPQGAGWQSGVLRRVSATLLPYIPMLQYRNCQNTCSSLPLAVVACTMPHPIFNPRSIRGTLKHMPKPYVLTISTNKGGAGKTTTAVHLSAGLALDGRRVLLVDLDKQGHCATFVGRDPAPRLYDLLVKERDLPELIAEVRPNLHLLASNSETLVAQDFARLRNAQADLLEDALIDKANGYDFIVFDTPPQGLLQECAIYSADLLVSPVPVDYPGMDGVAQFVQVIQRLGEREGRPLAPVYVIPMFVDLRTSESKYNLALLKERFGDHVLTPVPARTRMREAIAEGKTIFEYAPNEDIGGVYRTIARSLAQVAQEGAHG
jgi:chromosome partitioning protein